MPLPDDPHCTFAVTDAGPVSLNVHLGVSSPPLEHAPDQMAVRPLVTESVIDVPVANDAEPVLPTATLMPAGVDCTLSPLRPVAVTVSVAVPPGGGGGAGGVTVSTAVFVAPPNEPVIVTLVDAVTLAVVTPNVALVAPAGTVTFAGTVAAAVLLLDSVTTAPPAGAALVRVAVPVDAFPPTTLVGLSVIADSAAAGGGGAGGVTVSAAVFVAPPNEPVIVTPVEAVTVDVVTPNVALVAPAATVTLAGTVATAVLLLDSVTTAPPAGAALVSVAVPVDAFPPTTLVGLSAIADSAAAGGGAAAAFTVSEVEALNRNNPEIVTAVSAVTDVVEMGNVALVAPAGTVTLAGRLAAVLELNNCTTAPPPGAAL